jgi:hypothetical protein
MGTVREANCVIRGLELSTASPLAKGRMANNIINHSYIMKLQIKHVRTLRFSGASWLVSILSGSNMRAKKLCGPSWACASLFCSCL